LKNISFIIIIILLFSTAYGQDERVEHTYNGYNVLALYDTANYCSNLSITKNGKTILFDSCTGGRVEAITDYDLDGKGEKLLIIDFFTGGAHCCVFLTAAVIKNDQYVIKDTLFWGDSGYEIKDIDGDGVYEISGNDVRFAYAFTSFAGSQFPILIYQYKNGKFFDATKKFPKLIEKDLSDLKKNLDTDYLKKGYECRKPDEDIYSAESGGVQAYLAAITEDYYNLGRTDEAYEYINKVYKCGDKKKFIETLKKDYKLK
jgi:hypothetical protein